MFPREHGAYGQLGFPMATVFGLAGGTPASVALAFAIVAAFLAHEPLQVLLGARGSRARRELARRSWVWAALWGGVALAGGGSALAMMNPSDRWALLLPLVPAAYLFVSAARGQEKRLLPEVSVAVAFSLSALPLGLAAGLAQPVAALVAAAYAVTFTLMTLAVRAVVLSTRGGGRPAQVARMRRAVVVVSILALAATAGASTWGTWPAEAPWALLPGALAAGFLSARPPAAVHLRRVGWALIATSVATMALLVALAM